MGRSVLPLDKSGNVYIADWFNNKSARSPRWQHPDRRRQRHARLFGRRRPRGGAELSFPLGLAFDGAGNLYIADSANNVIREVTTDGNINTVVGNNTRGYSGDGGPPTGAQLYSPYAVARRRSRRPVYFRFQQSRDSGSPDHGTIFTLGGNGCPAMRATATMSEERNLTIPKESRSTRPAMSTWSILETA